MKELKVIFSKKWNFLKKMNFRKKIFKKVNMWPSKIEISFWIFVFERNTFKSIGKTTNKTCIHNWLVGEWQNWSKETMNGNKFNTHEIEKKTQIRLSWWYFCWFGIYEFEKCVTSDLRCHERFRYSMRLKWSATLIIIFREIHFKLSKFNFNDILKS